MKQTGGEQIPLMAPSQLGKTTLLYKEKQLGARRQAALQVKYASDLRIRRNRRGFVDSYEWYLLLKDAVAPFARTLRKKVGAPKECPVLVMYDNCSTHVAGTWKERCDEVKTFVRQRKIPYDMMLRVAGISAERAGADHNILKAEIREALDNRAQNGRFGNFGGGRKRNRQDEEGDEENEENEEEAEPAD